MYPVNHLAQDIGEVIRQEREDLGMTQEMLSKLAFTTQPVIDDIEEGIVNTNMALFISISACLGITPSVLLGVAEELFERRGRIDN